MFKENRFFVGLVIEMFRVGGRSNFRRLVWNFLGIDRGKIF